MHTFIYIYDIYKVSGAQIALSMCDHWYPDLCPSAAHLAQGKKGCPYSASCVSSYLISVPSQRAHWVLPTPVGP